MADTGWIANHIAAVKDPSIAPAPLGLIGRESLAERVYTELRNGLLQGRFGPGERLKIRDLGRAMAVSETPVREALLQLAREGGVEIVANRSIRVVSLPLAQYLELRRIRLVLEGLAGEVASTRIGSDEIDRLAELHQTLCDAQDRQDWSRAIQAGCEFHFRLYHASGMPELVKLLEQIWLRTAPLLNVLYRRVPLNRSRRHYHLVLIDALRARDAGAVRQALADDLIKGGEPLVKLMEDIEAGRAAAA